MQYQVTVDNGYGVDIVTFLTLEAAEDAAQRAEMNDAEAITTIEAV